MGDAQKIKAEHDIEAKRKVIKAEIDALLEKFPQLKYTNESSISQPDHVSGAAAQSTGPIFFPNFQGTNAKDMPWKPKLHTTQSSDAIGPVRAGGVGSCARDGKDCEIYQTIFHDEACHEILYLGGHI